MPAASSHTAPARPEPEAERRLSLALSGLAVVCQHELDQPSLQAYKSCLRDLDVADVEIACREAAVSRERLEPGKRFPAVAELRQLIEDARRRTSTQRTVHQLMPAERPTFTPAHVLERIRTRLIRSGYKGRTAAVKPFPTNATRR